MSTFEDIVAPEGANLDDNYPANEPILLIIVS